MMTASTQKGTRMHSLELNFEHPVQPSPRVEVHTKNLIVTFKKAAEGEWATLPNVKAGKKSKKKKAKAEPSPPPSPTVEPGVPADEPAEAVEDEASEAQLSEEASTAAAAAAAAAKEAKAAAKEAKAAKAAEEKAAKARREKEVAQAVAEKKAAKQRDEEAEEAKQKAAVEKKKQKKAAPQGRFGQSFQGSGKPQDLNYNKWDNLDLDTDSDDDPTPPERKRAPAMHGMAAPAPSNAMEEAVLNDPRLKEAARLIEIGRKTGDMALLQQAERLTHEALAATGMSQDQITQMMGTSPMAAPAAPKAAKPVEPVDLNSLDPKQMKDTMVSGLAELEAKQRAIQQEQDALEAIAASGGPEDFFKYMASQGMSPADITKILSGDTELMKDAVARKTEELDSNTMDTVSRVEQVAAQVEALKLGHTDPDALFAGPAPAPAMAGAAKPAAKGKRKIKVPIQEVPAPGAEAPVYTIEPEGGALKIRIELPKVASVGEIDMDVTRTALELEVPGVYKLKVRLPQPVDDDEVAAKWVKQERRLELTCGLE